MQDVYDHSLRVADLIESQRDLLTGLLEAHLAVVSNRMNDVMKKTSSYGAILLVSTLIAGIYGMNFRYMPELRWHYGYFVALAFMAIATIAALGAVQEEGLVVAGVWLALHRVRPRGSPSSERDAPGRRDRRGRSRRRRVDGSESA